MTSGPSTLQQFLGDAQDCASAMMEMAQYVQNELPNVKIEEPTRSKLTTLLPEIAGASRTLHETVALLYALQIPADRNLDQRGLIQNALQPTSTLLLSLNEIVGSLSESSKHDQSQSLAFVLVAASTVNILNPFNRASAAAERLLVECPEQRSAGGRDAHGVVPVLLHLSVAPLKIEGCSRQRISN